MSSWKIEPSGIFERKLNQYRKKHPNETKNALLNLDRYKDALDAGTKPAQIQGGFIHSEPHGVVAVDQRGARKGSKGTPRQTRLYIYAYVQEEVLYLITIGDKKSQTQDLKDCEEFINSLGEGR